MICLTGDLHHNSLETGNQQHCDIRELQVALKYLDLLKDAGVKVTFFISGKCFSEELNETKSICTSPLVEVGGHTWDCFSWTLWHRVWKKLTGSYNGPVWHQMFDTKRTIRTAFNKTRRKIVSWRNHMYMHGPNTERVLSMYGIKVCSDGVNRNITGPVKHPSGLWNFPINVIPDHEHLYHAERTPEWVEQWIKRYNWSDDFGFSSYHIEEWTEIVLDCLKYNESRGAISNMIIHPITMYLCDKFKSFEKILTYLSSKKTVFITETIPE
ncbi:MAG: polysaccharide deacetylase family protein [Candidatus Riflebacteria bacterium]|nr:polysaccharide deacetylase family protein [Candidatus Riflebacteria bacterium]